MTIKDIKDNLPVKKDSDLNSMFVTIKDSITKDNIVDVVEILKSSQIQHYIQYLVRKHINGESIIDADYQNLYLLIHILQTIYNYSENDVPVSDYDYDRLYELMSGYSGDEIITTPLLTKDRVVSHNYPSLPGTLKKIYALDAEDETANKNRGSLKDWIKTNENLYYEKTGERINLLDEDIYVFPKWDGVSVTFEFSESNELLRAITRGNTETNEANDVTFIFSTIVNRIRDTKMGSVRRPYGLKTEIMIREKDKKECEKLTGKKFKSLRSLIISIINSGSLDGREDYLEVVGLRTSCKDTNGDEELQELASDVFRRPYLVCKLRDTKAIREFAYKHHTIDGLNTDGAVIYIINEKIRKILGRKDHKNQYEVAFKFNEEIAYPKITDIDFRLTSFGRIFPNAKFTPVKMKGNAVSEVSLGSISRFNKLKLRKGDHVKILYEIVPYLVMDDDDPNCKRKLKNPIIAPPINCPECGDPLSYNENKTILACTNSICPCRLRGKIIQFIQKMNISGIGEETINNLFELGYLHSIVDLYTLKNHYEAILMNKGYNEVSVNNMLREIEKSRRVSAGTFMGALGIEGIGKETFNKIFSKYKIEDLIEFSESSSITKLISIHGIKETQALKILNGVLENRGLIDELLYQYITPYYESEENIKFTVYFHKIRSEELANFVRSNGGYVADNFTKKITFLIVPNGFLHSDQPTSKMKKAIQWDIPIIEIKDVKDFINKSKNK